MSQPLNQLSAQALSWQDLSPYLASPNALLPTIKASLKPQAKTSLLAWASEHLYITTEVSPKAGPWNADEFPFHGRGGPADALDDPRYRRVIAMKPSQVGFTMLAVAWLLRGAAQDPAPMGYVGPSRDLVKRFTEEKFDPVAEGSPKIAGLIRPTNRGQEDGSTSKRKKFDGGFISLLSAGSAKALKMSTLRDLAVDEIDEMAGNLQGQGSPIKMLEQRQTVYEELGQAKAFYFCTPTTVTDSLIYPLYKQGTQHAWKVPCPECGHRQELRFFPRRHADGRKYGGLVWTKGQPETARYVCEACEADIEHRHKHSMNLAGRWEAQNLGARDYSCHLSVLASPMVTWETVAAEFEAAQSDPEAMKVFINQALGEPTKVAIDVPKWEALAARKTEPDAPHAWDQGGMPQGPLVITAACDVQKRGIYWLIVGHGLNRERWVLDYGFYPGATHDHTSGAWIDVQGLIASHVLDPWGRAWPIDVTAIDTGYNSQQVYAFLNAMDISARRVIGVKGIGREDAPVLDTPTGRDIQVNTGRRSRFGQVKVWPVGTWGIKSALYGSYGLEANSETGEIPPGCWHWPHFAGRDFFQQITNEYLRETKTRTRGTLAYEWHTDNGNNHLLDCLVYNEAAYHRHGAHKWTQDRWTRELERHAPPAEGDLLSPNGAPVIMKPKKRKLRL